MMNYEKCKNCQRMSKNREKETVYLHETQIYGFVLRT